MGIREVIEQVVDRPAARRATTWLKRREAAWSVMATALIPVAALWTSAVDVTPWNAVLGFMASVTAAAAGAAMLAVVEWREKCARRAT